MKRKSFFLFVVSILFASSVFAYQADIKYVSARDYFKTALQEINKAQESIHLFMFVVSFKPDKPNSKLAQLLDALIKAKERGVEVSAYLDQNVNFYEGGNEVQGKNNLAAEYLTKHGVDVYLDNKYTFSHSKALVIDDKITLVGSSNWSTSAFTRNNEANILVKSKKYARQILEDLIPKQKAKLVEEKEKTVKIPKTLVTNKKLMGQMVTRHDERTFDIYLWLLKESGNLDTTNFFVKYGKLAEYLGIDSMTREDYRRQITKVLRKLETDYDLIAVETAFNQPANIILKLDKMKNKDWIEIPESYWKYHWNQKLSFPGKVMLLLNWLYSAQSEKGPSWHVAVDDLIKTHGISETFIGDGTMELRGWNLIEVQYREIGNASQPRQYGTYTPQTIYDPQVLEKQFRQLEDEKGKEVVLRARENLKIVFKENDYEDVKKMIDLEKLYGLEVIQKAVSIVEDKRITSSKRKMGYLIGTIKGIGERETGRIVGKR